MKAILNVEIELEMEVPPSESRNIFIAESIEYILSKEIFTSGEIQKVEVK